MVFWLFPNALTVPPLFPRPPLILTLFLDLGTGYRLIEGDFCDGVSRGYCKLVNIDINNLRGCTCSYVGIQSILVEFH